MIGQNPILQAFTRDLGAAHFDGEGAWLIKGDFDHFRATNDLYGSLFADYLLDWTLEVIQESLKSFQSLWNCGEILYSIQGDDMTIYIPPSARTAADVTHLLTEIREQIYASFWRRYRLAAVPLPATFFDDIPADRLEALRADLERLDIILDLAPRRRGFLFLYPVEPGDPSRQMHHQVFQLLRRWSGKWIPPVEPDLDWICDPGDPAGRALNPGYIDPPSVSFAACPTRLVSGLPADGCVQYERLCAACQTALKRCKLQGCGVLVNQASGDLSILPAQPPARLYAAPSSCIRWSSERYLREKIYLQPLDRPILFQINPVYHLVSGMPVDFGRCSLYRGNEYGMGLKGINEILGHRAGDTLIRKLMLLFSEEISQRLAGKGLLLDGIKAAQFVDRFTVVSTLPVFQLPEIVDVAHSLADQFNEASPEIKIAQVQVAIVQHSSPCAGYRLFHELELVNHAVQQTTLAFEAPRIEVRMNSPRALQEGSVNRERCVFSSLQLFQGWRNQVTGRRAGEIVPGFDRQRSPYPALKP